MTETGGQHRAPSRPRSRRAVLAAGGAGLLAAGAYGVSRAARHEAEAAPRGTGTPSPDAESPAPPGPGAPRLIGDGSTADTGPQPRQPEARRLAKGERPPQFVVISWDGAGELDDGLFARFLKLADEVDAAMTFFLSGLYLLPEARKDRYHPPGNPVGASDIGYLTDAHIRTTLEQLRAAWPAGHEIGTHFNGHFCAGPGSVERWSPQQWTSEIDQAVDFVTHWRTNTGFGDLDPLPFDYARELTGGRTPCLLGQDQLLPAARRKGWRYDASSPGGLQRWPVQRDGLWDFPLQALPFPGHGFEVLSMDYNLMANQSGNATQGALASRPAWREEARGAYRAGFERAYTSNRAPLFVGNHFEAWNGGIYMDAVEEAVRDIADRPETRLVSFRQLCDWLDAQDPVVLRALQDLDVAEAPAGGWARVVMG